MMRTLFEVNDFRKLPFTQKLASICLLEPKLNGLLFHQVTGRGAFIPLDSDTDFEKKGDDLTIYTEAGMVVLSPVTEESDVVQFMRRSPSLLTMDCLLA